MNSIPLVSIITPSYNQADFLEYTIQSVLKQDYLNLEYGIVDGGSADGSLDILKKYDPHLSWWISEPDQGQAQAINKGIARTSGNIIAWINSDDIYLPNAIKQAVKAIEEYEVDLVFGDAVTIDEAGYPLNELMFSNWDLPDLLRFRVICQPAVFMKRAVWEEVQGLSSDLHYMLDHQLWIKIASQFQVKHIPAFWAASRHHGQAKNVAFAAGFSAEILQLLTWIETEETLGALFEEDQNRIRGGAYRLSARYLLDGDFPAKAFKHYCQAIRFWPSYALIHWRRMIFALISIATGIRISSFQRQTGSPHLSNKKRLRDWPGLNFLENEFPTKKY
ncbi:MAG: glycosyltransferase [Anaerolineales bacterium]|nr:glycosyltransferase [Anaerolineales bacterium]